MKVCTKCMAEKPKSEFSKDKQKKDGKCSRCKACVSEQRAARVAENPEAERQRAKLWVALNPEKHKASQAKYRANSKQKTKERSARHYSENKDEIQARRREFYLANPENLEISRAKWKAENPEYIRACAQKRRAIKAGAEGSHTAADIKAIFESQRGTCASCPTKLIKSGKNRYHVDHIQPLSKGGSNDKYNLQCLCPGCNLKKWSKDPLDWAKEIGKLL